MTTKVTRDEDPLGVARALGLPTADDLCDLCYSSGVTVERTTYCGKTIGQECGCDDANEDGTCGNPGCEEFQAAKDSGA